MGQKIILSKIVTFRPKNITFCMRKCIHSTLLVYPEYTFSPRNSLIISIPPIYLILYARARVKINPKNTLLFVHNPYKILTIPPPPSSYVHTRTHAHYTHNSYFT